MRQARLAAVVADRIIPQLPPLRTEVLPEAPPVELVVEALAPSSSDISGLAHVVLGSDLEAAASNVLMRRFLEGAGWDVDSAFDRSVAEIAMAVGAQWYAVAGLTVSSERSLPALDETTRLIRRESRNQLISVMVGDPEFTANPVLALKISN